MTRPVQRFLGALALLAGFAASTLVAAPARAEPVAAADVKAVRAVIEAQLDAFAADDAQRAFSYAAPAIREQFGSAERFMAMVRAGYPVVYRPSGVVFLQPQWEDGTLVQGVQMTDQDGVAWIAVYNLALQPDRSWRITGCLVQPQTGRLT